jgi:thiamine biosynthesis lipoprotein
VEKAFGDAQTTVSKLTAIYSTYDPTSELSRINASAGGLTQHLSDELAEVFVAVDDWHQKSKGAFDPSLGPLVQYWRQLRRAAQAGEPITADAERIAKLREVCGWEKIQFSRGLKTIGLPVEGMALDLGGIAKGTVIDAVFTTLTEHGLPICLVDAGGDLRVGDPPPGQRGWRVAIGGVQQSLDDSPKDGNGLGPTILLMANQAVATSGDLFQFVEIDGKRYSHILDPATGLGVVGRSSVSVIAPDAQSADAAATAVSILGRAQGIAWVDSLAETECIYFEFTEADLDRRRSLSRKAGDLIEVKELSP